MVPDCATRRGDYAAAAEAVRGVTVALAAKEGKHEDISQAAELQHPQQGPAEAKRASRG